MAHEKRLSRKDLKQPDEFIVLSGQGFAWAQQHRTTLIAAAVAALILVLGLGLVSSFRAARRQDANVDLARGLAALRSDNLTAGAGELAEASRRWDSTGAGEIAGIVAGAAELRNGNPDTAIALLESTLEGANDLEPYLRQEALMSWGGALEAKEQWAEAAEKYSAAGAIEGPYAAPAVLSEARARERLGEAEASRELYRRYYEEFPDFPGREMVADRVGA